MKNVLIVGSIGLDNLKTPYGERKDILGGSISFASMAARIFSPASIIGVVGEDFPERYLTLFQEKDIDLSGLEIKQGGTFRWCGEYCGDMNEAITLDTQLNSFADFDPVLSPKHRDTNFLFLGNIQPDLQLKVLEQMNSPKFVMCDTMNLWINTMPERLKEVISDVNLFLVNDKEAKMLSGEENLILAARKILELGPEYLIIKKGEHGSMLFSKDSEMFILPAFPLCDVVDPTGAGDSFAGGLIGFLAQESRVDFEAIKRAMVSGTIIASFTTQDFGNDMLRTVTQESFAKRYRDFCGVLETPSLDTVLA